MSREKYIISLATIIAAVISIIGGLVFFCVGAIAELRSAGSTGMLPICAKGFIMILIGIMVLGMKIRELG